MRDHTELSTCAGCRAHEPRLARVERAVFGFASGAEDDSPLARGMHDLVTPRQLGNIRREAQAAGVDPEVECGRIHHCRTSDLSRAAADGLLKHLAGLARSQAQGGRG